MIFIKKSFHQVANLTLFLVSLGFILSCGQKEKLEQDQIDYENNSAVQSYDSILALEYGADDYGMKNIGTLAEDGKLVLAGPFFGNDELRGIYIFNVESIEEAMALTNTDPAIKAGTLVMDLKEWYGSAALIGVNQVHMSLMKKSMSNE